ncbi:MAG TPA: SDR family NAD(P)-dependent oxidoreductase, partial [Roseomonas sp.]|nr:SDR family NAD(P)-dependent oxidoreductase [Roseomonas sp.]
MKFNDKVAVVTGGGNGIGRAVCLGFAERGAKVLVVDRDADGAAAVAAEIGKNAVAFAADVTKTKDVQAYVARALDAFGRIDCFHNNAGIEGRVAPTAEYEEDMFDAVMGVNVKGVFLGLRHVLPVMIRQGSGA